jgi:thiol-disulfide isomerase/thioredoxin
MSATFLSAAATRHADASSLAPERLSVDAMLVELEIEKYREAFAAAAVDDDALVRARDLGEEAVEALISAVGLRGGSATKVRRKLLARAPPSARNDEPRQGKRMARRRETHAEAPPAPPAPPAAAAGQVRRLNGQLQLTSQSELERVFEGSSSVVVVQFKATWCTGCRKFSSTFAKLSDELRRPPSEDAAPSASMCIVDVDEAPELAHAYAVSQLPHFIIFREGRKWDVLIGGKATILRQKVLYAIEGRLFHASSTESKRKT